MNSVVLATLAIVFGNAGGQAQPRDTVRVDPASGSQVWIEGGSNLGGWRCKATAFEARIELASRAGMEADTVAPIRAIDVKVAVRDLKCGNRKMEHDLYAALNATDPATPAYIVARFAVTADSIDTRSIETRGLVSVAGVERPVTVPVTAERGADGLVRARGAIGLRMTDFGVKPPVGLFGLIRSRNEVTVRFDLIVPPVALAIAR